MIDEIAVKQIVLVQFWNHECTKMSNINLSGNWQKVGQARRDSRQLNKDVSEK
jgi:hypothetical protein